eukprot:CAMPEP_0172202254 /NCGR_PEP_ID=MMETSP1050-20130122/30529_1 /TAXON_ID=233186 /ORGANISM="Cryptomonas curvata, Strain CCAP979/52" /LENGTH=221 /DNA_ID=CAMNT_0012880143 /DNA_START=29 /DNA_END=694 /DNA_ORIENTATION=+
MCTIKDDKKAAGVLSEGGARTFPDGHALRNRVWPIQQNDSTSSDALLNVGVPLNSSDFTTERSALVRLAPAQLIRPVAQERPLPFHVLRVPDRQQHAPHRLVHQLRHPQVEREAPADQAQPPARLERARVAVPVRDRQQHKGGPERQKGQEHDAVLPESAEPAEEGEDAPQKKECSHKRIRGFCETFRRNARHGHEDRNRPPECSVAEEHYMTEGGSLEEQ